MKKVILSILMLCTFAAAQLDVRPAKCRDASQSFQYPFSNDMCFYSAQDLTGAANISIPAKISAAPVNSTFTSGAGTLATGTYYYRVTGKDANNNETLPSAETSLAITGPAGVNVNWGATTGETNGYNIYGRTTGGELFIGSVAHGVTTFLDNGSVTPSGAMPTANNTGLSALFPTIPAGMSQVHALTFSFNCTQAVDVNVQPSVEDGGASGQDILQATTGFKVVTAVPVGWNQLFIANELAPNVTNGTLGTVIRLPQRALQFQFANNATTAGTCTPELNISLN